MIAHADNKRRAVTDVVGDDGLARCLWGYSTPDEEDKWPSQGVAK